MKIKRARIVVQILARFEIQTVLNLSFSGFVKETLDGVLHKAADCHRAYSAWDRSDDRGLRLD